MNIFYLHSDPDLAAQDHIDKHVIKMVLETAQMLSTAHRLLDGIPIHNTNLRLLSGESGDQTGQIINARAYKHTHVNHPCTVWVRRTSENYLWAFQLMHSLNKEKLARYGGRDHLAYTKHLDLLSTLPSNIPSGSFTTPALAMPDEYKVDSPVESYRNYYMGAKRSIASWKGKAAPSWFI